ncbi:hypothetical protein ASPZODRAFT_127698 [Penicilliopsis zonata CBS 506.65]|uniref:Ribonuclease T2-like n=1 Tax=Penicilliopsis zonata CBS 506.65 TaxID=1073090 RepID=A0A1L9SWQ2_9EURO|nr:hypothetical protein ASPZODRAFT_127698 [Penicilliopsis zonata CBS 506.65]OJJ51599.1 hypothetical protein ASPZODRAFT_127698 [Penicilliopsis zonata CBS 506.65]
MSKVPGPQRILKALTSSLGLSALSELQTSPHGYSACNRADLSCQTKYDGQNLCCFNYPGGQMLLTQFWDADPAIGPDDSWTIHGLWPDHCDGGFDQYCDSKRQYSNISLILIDAGRGDLLDYMGKFWKDFRGDDNSLYEHEWNKHGTCISTLETKCYSDYLPQEEVVDYFNKTVEIFEKLPSYEFLANAGIVPSNSDTYALADIANALQKGHGAEVTVRCRYGALNEIWYHFNIAGPLQTGDFVPSAPDGMKSNCPATGIRYKPKRPKKEPSRTSPGYPNPTGTEPPSTNKGYLKVSTMGQARGCIISRGEWFVSGTCATFRSKKIDDDTFALSSSKGPCTFEQNIFECGPLVTSPSTFSIESGKLSYQGNTTFFADKAPKGATKSKIFAAQDEHQIELEIKLVGF